MKLLLQTHVTNNHIDDTYALETVNLTFKATHLFIAGNTWDSIDLDVTDDINPEDVKYLTSICSNVHCNLPETVTQKTLSILCSIYPQLSGKLRLGYMLKKDLARVLP